MSRNTDTDLVHCDMSLLVSFIDSMLVNHFGQNFGPCRTLNDLLKEVKRMHGDELEMVPESSRVSLDISADHMPYGDREISDPELNQYDAPTLRALVEDTIRLRRSNIGMAGSL